MHHSHNLVMPGQKREARLRADVPGIHVLWRSKKKDVDGRDKPGHDEGTNPSQGISA
jgi:hypothetical protein